MEMSEAGVKALETREGSKLLAYQDTKGVWTIGVGHTGTYNGVPIHKGMRLSQSEVDALFAMDISKFSRGVDALIKVPVTQNQFDAMVSFAFNIGLHGFEGSSALKSLNAKKYSTAADDMLMWMKPPELRRRREGEREQFLTPDTKVASTATVPKSEDKVMSSNVVKDAEAAGVNILAGLKNVFGNIVSTLEAAAPAVTSDKVPEATTSTVGSPSDLSSAAGAIKELISDIENKKYTDLPEDVFALLTAAFSILAKFNVNVPGASIVLKVLSGIATVV